MKSSQLFFYLVTVVSVPVFASNAMKGATDFFLSGNQSTMNAKLTLSVDRMEGRGRREHRVKVEEPLPPMHHLHLTGLVEGSAVPANCTIDVILKPKDLNWNQTSTPVPQGADDFMGLQIDFEDSVIGGKPVSPYKVIDHFWGIPRRFSLAPTQFSFQYDDERRYDIFFEKSEAGGPITRVTVETGDEKRVCKLDQNSIKALEAKAGSLEDLKKAQPAATSSH